MSRRRDDGATVEPSEAGQAYLLALRWMTGGGGPAMAASLARKLGVTTQAASEMVGRRAVDGLVNVSPERSLALTAAGIAAADTIFRRHALLEWLLTRVVGLGWAESDEEAARLQGAISPRVEAGIARLLGDPPTCPHGNPINAAAALSRPAGIRLSEVGADEEITIYRITEEAEEDAELLVYLEREGLTPGAVARVVESSSSRDSVTLDGPRSRTTMGLRPAALIRVLPGRADPALFHRVPPEVAGLIGLITRA